MSTKSVLTATIGGAIEWYDFVIFGFFADIIGTQFFPESSEQQRLFYVFCVFAVSYFMRPIGSILFGYIGDKHGRSYSLRLTMFLGSGASITMAFMPNYYQIGFTASILFLIARMLQGLTVGVNISGSLVYVTELTKGRHRGFWVSIVFLSLQRGFLLATTISSLLFAYLPHQYLNSWGWRLAFLVGSIIIYFSFHSKGALIETPYHNRLIHQNRTLANPTKNLFSNYKISILLAFAINATFASSMIFILFYMPTLLRFYNFANSSIVHVAFYTIFIFSLIIPLWGWLSMRVKPHKLLYFGAIGMILLAYPCLSMITSQNLIAQYLGLTILITNITLIATVSPVIMSGLFPTAVRYSGFSVAYNFSLGVFNGSLPLILFITNHFNYSSVKLIT
ncbi:MAG: hypothetical protein RL017_594, partial [Pseudomonadota bacterium]